MPFASTLSRAGLVVLVALLPGACGSDRLTGFLGSNEAPAVPVQASAPPVNMAGRWLLTSPGRGQCHVNFGAANATAVEGTVAPEGGCPGKFFTGRKWTFEQGNLVIRDHNSQPLAQLAAAGNRFDGKATTGEPISLFR